MEFWAFLHLALGLEDFRGFVGGSTSDRFTTMTKNRFSGFCQGKLTIYIATG